jgi:hypothetical protein
MTHNFYHLLPSTKPFSDSTEKETRRPPTIRDWLQIPRRLEIRRIEIVDLSALDMDQGAEGQEISVMRTQCMHVAQNR